MSLYSGLIISDIHVGAFDIQQQFMEWNQIFIQYIQTLIEKNCSLNFIIITGDFFDHKFYLNDKESVIAYQMLMDLLTRTEPLHTKIRIIYGTESHEANQYELVPTLLQSDRVKVIKTASEEELFPDLFVLYLPEEYVEDKESYYSSYFHSFDHYDYIFGHGVIREVASSNMVVHLEKKTKRKSVPIFNSKELEEICKGQIFFGHYHIRKILNDKIFSVGSFSRYQFGQEEEKGFYHIHCDTKHHSYTYQFIENTLAQSYKTISFGYQSDIFQDENQLEEEFNQINALLDKNILDHVRFEINLPTNIENPEATIQHIKEKLKHKEKIKINIVNGYINEKKEQQKKEIQQENETYGFLFESLPIEEKIERFIAIEYHKELSKEKINQYFMNEIQTLL